MIDTQSHAARRPVVLVFSRYYLPGYRAGGTVRSLSNMVAGISKHFDFRIVTSDRDIGDSCAYENLALEKWSTVGEAHVYYIKRMSPARIVDFVKQINPDIVYLNCFFDPAYSLLPLFARHIGMIEKMPLIIACRGQLSGGSLRIKQLKKKVYLGVARALQVYRDATFHASSLLEAQDIQNLLGDSNGQLKSVRVAVVRDLPSFGSDVKRTDIESKGGVRSALKVCFLSRISPVKNLDVALRVLRNITCEIEFNIYGPIESQSYWGRCQEIMRGLPETIRAKYCGAVKPDRVLDELSGHDLFFLPTGGENYGHVIHEALSAGLPVLLSDQTSWSEVERHGVGWCVPLCDLGRMQTVIEEVAAWDVDKAAEVRYLAKKFAFLWGATSQDISANIDLFSNVLTIDE